jgi:4-hydroxybenzoate polyprenyltransferase
VHVQAAYEEIMAQPVGQSVASTRQRSVVYELLRAMRPKQWIKNAFVFGAIAFSNDRLWMRADQLLLVIGAFLIFCACSGAIYLLNDLVDIEKDRAHPKKRNRPLASGRLNPTLALVVAIALMVGVLGGSVWIDSLSSLPALDYSLMLVMLAYILIQGVLYSFFLKNIVILDIFTIAAGFVLRAVAGGVVLDIRITPWLLICMGLLAIFLGLGKRRAEIVLLGEDASSHRKILQEYSIPMLDQMISIVTAATLMAYTLFTYTATTLPLEPYPVMMTTVPLVIYAIFRYLYLIHHRGGGGSPEELVLKDRPLAAAIGLYGILVLALLSIFRQG